MRLQLFLQNIWIKLSSGGSGNRVALAENMNQGTAKKYVNYSVSEYDSCEPVL